jgi:hypothetical protein
MVGVVRRLLALVVAVCGVALASAARAQGQDDLARLNAEVIRLHEQGKFAEALPIAQRFVELARQRLGEEHPGFAMAVSSLAIVYSGPRPLRRGRATLQAQPRHQRESAGA